MNSFLPSTKLYTIGDIAKILKVSIGTLRRWEKQGRLKSIRTAGGHRRYSLENIKLLKIKKEFGNIPTHQTSSQPTPQPLYVVPPIKFPFKKIFKIGLAGLTTYLIIFTVSRTNILSQVISYLPEDIREKVQMISNQWSAIRGNPEIANYEPAGKGAVLAQSVSQDLTFDVNIASKFAENATFEKDVEILGGLTAGNLVTNGNITAQSITSGAVRGTTGTFTGTLIAPSLSTNATTFDLINTNATTLNIGGAATTISLGAGSGTSSVNNDLTVKGKLTVNGTSTLTGAATLSSTLAVSGATTLSSTLAVSGNSTFGNITKINGITYSFPSSQGVSNSVLTNNASGTLTWTTIAGAGGVTGTGAADRITFWSGTSTIASSANLGWSNSTNTLTVTGTSNLAGSATIGGATSDLITFTGRIASGTSLLPAVNLGSDLGSSLLKFNNIYAANLNIDSGITFSGQLLVTYNPTDTTFEQSSIRVNVTTPAANEQMLGIGQAGEERAAIDAEGDLTLGYDGIAGSSIPESSFPFSIYNHGTSQVAYIDTGGNLSLSGYATASASLAVGYTSAPAGPGNAIFQGNVGIGIAVPTTSLHVQSATATTNLTQSTTTTSYATLKTLVGGNASSLITYGPAAVGNYTSTGIPTANLSILYANGSALLFDQAANAPIYFSTSDTTPRMTITGGGSIGIGTTLPDAALEINHATGNNLRLTYNDSNGSAANRTDFTLGTDGDLTIDSTGGNINLSDISTLTANNTTTTSITQFIVNGSQSNIASLGSTNFYGANFAPSYATGTNPLNALTGVLSNPLNNATGTGANALSNLWGFNSSPGNTSTGTVTDARGFYAAPYNNSSGTITQLLSFVSQPNNVSTGTIGTVYGFYAAAPLNAGGGTISNKYAFVSESGAGNVGIGTITPGTTLEVNGGGNFATGLRVGFAGAPTADRIEIGDGTFYIDLGNTALPLIAFDSNDYFAYNRTDNYYAWNIGAGEKMRLNSSGHLGINNSSPAEALDIVGNATMSGTLGFKAIFPTDVPTCDVTAKGKIYYDGGRNQHYFCNGTNWRSLVGLQDHARQDVTTNNTVHNQIVRKGWNYVADVLNGGFYGTTTVTYGITFDDIPIVTMTPAGYKDTSPAPTALSDCTGASVAIPGGNEIVSQIRSLSTTTFVTEIGASLPTAASANADHKWCFTWAAVGTYAAGADLAEYYKSTEKLEPGDVVAISKTEDKKVNKSGGSYDKNAIGIVSTRPGQVLGDEDGKSTDPDAYPIALAGRVPVKVSLQGGVIERGDPLTSSSVPGVAMKATGAGPIIGRAMERFDGTSTISTSPYDGKVDANDPDMKELSKGIGKVMVFIDNSWWGETNQTALSSIENIDPVALFEKFGEVKSSLLSDEILKINNLTSDYLNLSSVSQENGSEVASIKDSIASVSGQLANIAADVELLKSTQLVATISANILGTATDSAQLTDLSVLRNTILADTVVNGKLNVGLITIDNIKTAIDAIGILRLQPLGLGDIDIMNGLVVIDTKGNVKISKGQIVGNSSFRGSVNLKAGQTTVLVTQESPWESTPASITTTPSYNTNVWVTNKTTTGFTINVSSPPPSTGATIDWLAIW